MMPMSAQTRKVCADTGSGMGGSDRLGVGAGAVKWQAALESLHILVFLVHQ